jgi:hypothetical protein
MTEPGASVSHDYLEDLLTRWRDGVVSPPEAIAEARAVWLTRVWSTSSGSNPDSVRLDILFMLAGAREMGITHEDIPALLEYLNTSPGGEMDGRERFGNYIEGIDSRERQAIQASNYYGPSSAGVAVHPMEFAIPDPEERRIHRAIRLDPESVWDEVRAQLCAPPPRDELFLEDIVEDLLYAHADAFIDRLEQLAANCPEAQRVLAAAHIGGIASSPALERFWDLQDRLERDLVARGEMYVWRSPADQAEAPE